MFGDEAKSREIQVKFDCISLHIVVGHTTRLIRNSVVGMAALGCSWHQWK